jgi:hypothetical protein
MSKLWLLILCAPAALAQLDSNTITYTAFRNTVAPPDQMDFTVHVGTEQNGVLDDVLAIVKPAGVTAANLTSVGSGYLTSNPLDWVFDLTVDFSKAQATAAALDAVVKQSPSVSYSPNGVRSATNLQDSLACPTADLMAEARSQGRAMAELAGGTLGQILALSDQGGAGVIQTYSAPGVFQIPVPTAVYSSSFASFLLGSVGQFGYSIAYAIQPTCALTVKFALIRYQ